MAIAPHATASAPMRARASRLQAMAMPPTTASNTQGASTRIPFDGRMKVLVSAALLKPMMPMNPLRVDLSTPKS